MVSTLKSTKGPMEMTNRVEDRTRMCVESEARSVVGWRGLIGSGDYPISRRDSVERFDEQPASFVTAISGVLNWRLFSNRRIYGTRCLYRIDQALSIALSDGGRCRCGWSINLL